MMTLEQITDWCLAREFLKAEHTCYATEELYTHDVKFENGDVYECKQVGRWSNCHNTIKINGITVYDNQIA